MQLWSNSIYIKQLIDYQSSQHQSHNTCVTIMKFLLLCLDVTASHHSYPRVSRRFESIYTLQVRTWQRVIRMLSRTLRMTTVHLTVKKSIRVPPLPSTRLPRDTARGAIRGWPVHYPCCLDGPSLQEWWGIVRLNDRQRYSVYWTP